MSIEELIQAIDSLSTLMIRVAVGELRIADVDDDYKNQRRLIAAELHEIGVENPNPHASLWEWFKHWKANFNTYQERREYIMDMFKPTLTTLESGPSINSGVFDETTGWERVDRSLMRVKRNLNLARSEEDFQSIGLLCRETIISVAQHVYDPVRHVGGEDISISQSDAKRMLEAYFGNELEGPSNEAARRHARASLDLANSLQHKRTADFRDAALCAEATIAVINIVAIISGRRNQTSNNN